MSIMQPLDVIVVLRHLCDNVYRGTDLLTTPIIPTHRTMNKGPANH